jgi:predicted acetyltransferase
MIVRPAESAEYAEVCDMAYSAFEQGDFERRIIKVTTEEDPNFRRGDLRVSVVDGKIVSMMMIIRRSIRIGSAAVNGAIVAPVATHKDFRGKGHCSAVMRNAVQYMKAQGFDITILWGIPWLYPRYGYSAAMMKAEVAIKPQSEVHTKKDGFELRPFVEGDLHEIANIYHNNTATKTCAEIRTQKLWEWKPRSPNTRFMAILNKKGEIAGYYVLGKDWGRPCALEVGVLNDEACIPLFNCLVEEASRKDLKELPCLIHPHHLFAQFAFWHNCEVEIQSGGGAGMAQVLNLPSLLVKMTKELKRRMQQSELHQWEGTLEIKSEDKHALLEFDRGEISVFSGKAKGNYELNIPWAQLNPLVTGYKSIQEIFESPSVRIKGGKKALRLIEILFPKGYPSGGLIPLFWE